MRGGGRWHKLSAIEAGAACPLLCLDAIAQRLHAKSTRSHPKIPPSKRNTPPLHTAPPQNPSPSTPSPSIDLHRITTPQHSHRRRRRDHRGLPRPRQRSPPPVTISGPQRQVIVHDHRRAFLHEHERSDRQTTPRQLMKPPPVSAAEDAFTVQLAVHLRRRRSVPDDIRPSVPIGQIAAMAAFAARAVAGGEGDGLVVEVEVGPAVGQPLLPPPTPELQGASDPQVAGVEADDVPAAVDHATVAGPGPAQGKGLDVAGGGDAVALRAPRVA
ncbi:hypothetical protein JJ691_36990 [Kutzneria sp. CA-103260]|nr:hypothetical protein JJ691_36990 [Kutzneria sp. CA-103260]